MFLRTTQTLKQTEHRIIGNSKRANPSSTHEANCNEVTLQICPSNHHHPQPESDERSLNKSPANEVTLWQCYSEQNGFFVLVHNSPLLMERGMNPRRTFIDKQRTERC